MIARAANKQTNNTDSAQHKIVQYVEKHMRRVIY